MKETNWNQIVMSKDFETLDQPLMVQIIRRRELPPVKSLLEPHCDDINSKYLLEPHCADINSKFLPAE